MPRCPKCRSDKFTAYAQELCDLLWAVLMRASLAVQRQVGNTVIPKVQPHRRIDKSALAIPVPNRIRSRKYLAFIRRQVCCIPGCGRTPCEPHHLTCSAQYPKARGLTAGDDDAVPLCPGPNGHHGGPDSPHHAGDERAWWASHGLDPNATAAAYRRRFIQQGGR